MRLGVLVLGFLILAGGIVAFGYGVPAVLFGYTYAVTNPYRGFGIMLILLGTIIAVLGAAVEGSAPVGPAPRTTASQTPRTCANCGQELKPFFFFCTRCGHETIAPPVTDPKISQASSKS